MIHTDIHCHILFGVDDGSESLEETKKMLNRAKESGIENIICTPHVYSSDTDFEKIHATFDIVKEESTKVGIKLKQGYECNYRVLLQEEAESMHRYCFEGTNVLLLEPPSGYLPDSWELKIYDIQRAGLKVIIAHPERCKSFQEDISYANRMLDIGCELQVSANDLFGSIFSTSRKNAVKMMKAKCVSYIASDAHCVDDYRYYIKAMHEYSALLIK